MARMTTVLLWARVDWMTVDGTEEAIKVDDPY
jgi:hypothetical protein